MYKHILFPTDGSELSERAAREGVRFAKSIGAQLTVLHTTPLFYPTELHAHSAPERAPLQRTTSTGSFVSARTFCVSLPASRSPSGRGAVSGC